MKYLCEQDRKIKGMSLEHGNMMRMWKQHMQFFGNL
jgi:hypothetical protein